MDKGNFNKRKVKCLLCGKYFLHVMSHCWQSHHVLSRDYKKQFGLDIQKSLTADSVKEKQKENAQNNRDQMLKNLAKNISARFVKGHTHTYERSQQTIEKLSHLHETRKKALKNCKRCGKEIMVVKWRKYCFDCMPEIKNERQRTPESNEYHRQWYKNRATDPAFVAHRKETHAEWVKNNREKLREKTRNWLHSKNCKVCNVSITRYSKTGMCIHCFNKSNKNKLNKLSS
jgi:hypothetical protein